MTGAHEEREGGGDDGSVDDKILTPDLYTVLSFLSLSLLSLFSLSPLSLSLSLSLFSAASVLESVLGFEAFDSRMRKRLCEVFHRHGIPIDEDAGAVWAGAEEGGLGFGGKGSGSGGGAGLVALGRRTRLAEPTVIDTWNVE